MIDQIEADNLAAHKVSGMRQTIESSGAKRFYLPPYSADLNPIEFTFSKLKSLLRKAAARTVYALWKTIGKVLYLGKVVKNGVTQPKSCLT